MMSTHKGSAGFPQRMLSQGPGCSKASSTGRAPPFPNPTAPPPCFPVECALKCDPSRLCPQSWTKVLSGQFGTAPLHKTDTWVFKSKVPQKYAHKNAHVINGFAHIMMYQKDEELFLDQYIHILYVYNSMRCPVYLTRTKITDKMKFSSVNEKEIYQNMKSKNLENTPCELWSTRTPTPYCPETHRPSCSGY